MKHEEFKVGGRFSCGERRWLVTDVGTRTVVALCLTTDSMEEVDDSWLSGPPYALAETVFDEDDIGACEAIPAA